MKSKRCWVVAAYELIGTNDLAVYAEPVECKYEGCGGKCRDYTRPTKREAAEVIRGIKKVLGGKNK